MCVIALQTSLVWYSISRLILVPSCVSDDGAPKDFAAASKICFRTMFSKAFPELRDLNGIHSLGRTYGMTPCYLNLRLKS